MGLSAFTCGDRADGTQQNLNTWSTPPMQSANDMKAHEKTYGSFVGLLKWSVPALFVLTMLIVFVIA